MIHGHAHAHVRGHAHGHDHVHAQQSLRWYCESGGGFQVYECECARYKNRKIIELCNSQQNFFLQTFLLFFATETGKTMSDSTE